MKLITSGGRIIAAVVLGLGFILVPSAAAYAAAPEYTCPAGWTDRTSQMPDYGECNHALQLADLPSVFSALAGLSDVQDFYASVMFAKPISDGAGGHQTDEFATCSQASAYTGDGGPGPAAFHCSRWEMTWNPGGNGYDFVLVSYPSVQAFLTAMTDPGWAIFTPATFLATGQDWGNGGAGHYPVNVAAATPLLTGGLYGGASVPTICPNADPWGGYAWTALGFRSFAAGTTMPPVAQTDPGGDLGYLYLPGVVANPCLRSWDSVAPFAASGGSVVAAGSYSVYAMACTSTCSDSGTVTAQGAAFLAATPPSVYLGAVGVAGAGDVLAGSGSGIFDSLGAGLHHPIMALGLPLAGVSICIGLVLRWVRKAVHA